MSHSISVSTPAIHLNDESFDPVLSNVYHLSLAVDERTFAFALLDTRSNKYLVLHHAPFKNTGDIISAIHAFHSGAFRSLTCAVAHHKFTLVPGVLFDEANKESLLGFNHPVEINEKIHSDSIQNINAKNLFTISRTFETEIRNEFPKAHFLHTATAFIEGLIVQNKNNPGKKVFANFHSGYFEISILDGRELLFSNAFTYSNEEEIAYYVLFVYEQMHLNPEQIELVLSGDIEKISSRHSLLYTYIRLVKFAPLPENFKYSYKLDELPSHTFFALYNQYLCV